MSKLSMICCRRIAMYFFIMLAFTNLQAQQRENLRHEIQSILRHEHPVDFSIVPSIVVLTWDQYFIAIDTFGQAMPNDHSNSDFFELGGLTQPVTAYLTEEVLKAYRLTQDSLILPHMPNHLQDPKWQGITFRHILEHRAGLPTIPFAMGSIEQNIRDPYRDFDGLKLLEEIDRMQPTPGKYSYSNLGYAFLYWLFDRMEGYPDYAEIVFSPEGGKIELDFGCDESCLTQGHGLNGKPTLPWHTNAMQPAIGLNGTIRGMYNFIQLWREDHLDELPSFSQLKKELAENDRAKTYLIFHGWFVVRTNRSVILYHTGHTGGHQVSAAFLPKENKGVLIFSNGAAGSHDLCFSILTMLQRAKQKLH